MKINLIVLAMEEELNGVLKQLTSYEIIENKFGNHYKFSLNGTTYIMTLGKIGKVSTGLFLGYLSSIYDIERVFNVGTSGGLNLNLNVGDVVIASEIMYYDVDVRAFNYQLGQVPSCPLKFVPDNNYLKGKKLNKYNFKIHHGLIVSGDNFLTKENVKDKIPGVILSKALCGEMESGAVAQSCFILKIPFIIIRSISDIILEENNKETYDNALEIASSNAGRVLIDLIN